MTYNNNLTYSFNTQDGRMIEAENNEVIIGKTSPYYRKIGRREDVHYLKSDPTRILVGDVRFRIIQWNLFSAVSGIIALCGLGHIFFASGKSEPLAR